MMLPLYASLERIDPRLLEAGGDLYATPFTAFRKVTWPLSLPGVVAGTLLTFIPAAGDYINSKLLGNAEHHDDRQRHRRAVPAGPRLPDGGRAVVLPDGSRSSCSSSSTSAAPGRRSWSDGDRSTPGRPARRPASPPRRPRGPVVWLREHLIQILAVCAFVYLFLPNVVVMLFSFNKPDGSLQLHVAAVLARRLAAPVRRRRACASPCRSASRSACWRRSSPPSSAR